VRKIKKVNGNTYATQVSNQSTNGGKVDWRHVLDNLTNGSNVLIRCSTFDSVKALVTRFGEYGSRNLSHESDMHTQTKQKQNKAKQKNTWLNARVRVKEIRVKKSERKGGNTNSMEKNKFVSCSPHQQGSEGMRGFPFVK
jgi:hypothetical protein